MGLPDKNTGCLVKLEFLTESFSLSMPHWDMIMLNKMLATEIQMFLGMLIFIPNSH